MLHSYRQPAERLHTVPIATQIEESMHKDPIRTTFTSDDVDIVIHQLRRAIEPVRQYYWERGLDIKIDDFDYGAESPASKITVDLTDIAKKMNKQIEEELSEEDKMYPDFKFEIADNEGNEIDVTATLHDSYDGCDKDVKQGEPYCQFVFVENGSSYEREVSVEDFWTEDDAIFQANQILSWEHNANMEDIARDR